MVNIISGGNEICAWINYKEVNEGSYNFKLVKLSLCGDADFQLDFPGI